MAGGTQAEVGPLDNWKGQKAYAKKSYKGQKGYTSLLREVEIHQRLADRHIIQFYDSEYITEDGERRIQLVMEHAECGTLQSTIPRLQWGDKERIAGEIAHGLSYVHSLGIIHCDIKSENVLLTKKLEAKLCDFGSAMTAEDKQRQKPSIGTDEYTAPEFLKDATAYSPGSDIYSLGVVMWEMAAAPKPPFSRKQFLEGNPGNVPHEYRLIMQACCDEDPKCRPASTEIALLKYGLSLKKFLEILKRYSTGNASLDRANLRVLSKYVLGTNTGGTSTNALVTDFAELEQTLPENQDTPSDNSCAVHLKLAPAVDEECDMKAKMALQYYQEGLYDQALDYARQASHRHPGCCYLLAQMYSKGHGVEMNQGEAYKWDLEAAEGGFSVSQHYIGLRFFQAGNYTEALRWYRKAAEQGDQQGEFKLGLMHYYGHGMLKKYPREGEIWIHKAASQGCIPAIKGMGIICLEQQRFPEAMEWFLKAVEDPISEYHIGTMYQHACGVLPNYDTAMDWFQRSAKKNYSLAEYTIGSMYRDGMGVDQDWDKAIEWYTKARDHGDPDAANELAMAYRAAGDIEKEYVIEIGRAHV